MTTAISGFRATGIWPVDTNIFTEHDFLASVATDINLNVSISTDQQNISNNDSTLITQHSSLGCSYWPEITEKQHKKAFLALSPEKIQPIPKSNKIISRTSRRRGKAAILTESPYKNELLATNKNATPRQVKRSLSFGKNKSTKTIKKNQTIKKKTKTNEENEECLYCNELYSTSVDEWIQCSTCTKWAHCLCAGIEGIDYETMFNCEFCS